jgi:hypothetical protein
MTSRWSVPSGRFQGLGICCCHLFTAAAGIGSGNDLMARLRSINPKHRASSSGSYRPVAPAKNRTLGALGKRVRGISTKSRSSFIPPENWHEPKNTVGRGYRVLVQPPGEGFVHVATPQQIRDRLAVLPKHYVERLEVVQLSRMTRKKQSFPCYGMQWGTAIYLYPVDESLIEHYAQPPRPALYNEARQFGGQWVHEGGSAWKLIWTKAALEDFYLNNVLIHELGHLLDFRNDSYRDRERFAEWFAIEHGYKPSRRTVKPAV